MEKQFNSLREKIAFEKKERLERYEGFRELVNKAIAAGLQAGKDSRPVPMYIIDKGIPIDRIDDPGRLWLCMDYSTSGEF